MDEVKFLNDIEILREISRKIQEPANNNEALVYILNSLSPEVKNRNYKQYQSATGPIRTIRKEISALIKDRYISYEEMKELIDTEKRKYPVKTFHQYPTWYNILYPLIFEEFMVEMKAAIKGVVDYTLTTLQIRDKVTAKKFDFEGPWNTGSNRCWIAFINKTHTKQQTAKQLFIEICKGQVEYSFYDRPLDKKEDIHIIPYHTPFKADEYISVFEKYLPQILADNYIIEDYNVEQNMAMDHESIYRRKIVYPLNQILYGPPGTGKTYHTINRAIEIIENLTGEELQEKYPDRDRLKLQFNNLLIQEWQQAKGQIIFVTFHQSMSYEDFIEGIKPTVNDKQQVAYHIESGIFKKIAEIARHNWEKEKRVKPYVLIIDEINRGNVSHIFGELITLVEEDKRLGNKESLEVILPYSKEKFGVPPNLYIIGTMNTADRSVEALDTALRRRFCFTEMPPEPDLSELARKITLSEKTEIELKNLLDVLNARLEVLLDKDHLIGHSYFTHIQKASELQDVFQRNILPLLQEYFFGDYGKIGLVLGKGFIETPHKHKSPEDVFADFEYEDTYELLDKTIYKIKDVHKMTPEEFEDAIRRLLRM